MLTGDYPVIAEGRSVGSLNISQNGLMTVFDCACDYISQEVLRLAAVCDGKYILLGVMMPEAGILRVKKSCTKNTLAGLGYQDTDIFHLIRNGDVYSQKDETLPEHTPIIQAPVNEAGQEAHELPFKPVREEADPVSIQPEPEQAQDPDLQQAQDPDVQLTQSPDIQQAQSPDIQQAQIPDNQQAQAPDIHAVFSEPMPSDAEPVLQVRDENPLPPHPDPEINMAQSDKPDLNGWNRIARPRVLFNDSGIAEVSDEISGALTLERDGLVYLAVPLLPNEPFPMMPVFCFGNSEEIGGQEYIVFKIKNGNLTL